MMKRTLVIFGIAVAMVGLMVVAVFAGASLVQAQAPTPDPQAPWSGRGGMMGGNLAMSETMHAVLAEKLGITEEDLESQIAEGKTFWQVAEEKGLTSEEATALMQEARQAALEQMVAAGTITQAQADRMSQRGGTMMGGRGGCPMGDNVQSGGRGFSRGRGMMGRRQ